MKTEWAIKGDIVWKYQNDWFWVKLTNRIVPNKSLLIAYVQLFCDYHRFFL